MRNARVEKEHNWVDSTASPEENDIIEVALWLMEMQVIPPRLQDETPTLRLA